VWKRSHGCTTKAPPDERGGNGYVQPTATATHLDSTHRDECDSGLNVRNLRTSGLVKDARSTQMTQLPDLLIVPLRPAGAP
jgi:hypothetical protein